MDNDHQFCYFVFFSQFKQKLINLFFFFVIEIYVIISKRSLVYCIFHETILYVIYFIFGKDHNE